VVRKRRGRGTGVYPLYPRPRRLPPRRSITLVRQSEGGVELPETSGADAVADQFLFWHEALLPLTAGDADPVAVAADRDEILAVDLFKNGLAVVKCEVTLGKPGTYVLEDVPSPVHGTYYIEGSTAVETVMRMRDVEVPATEAAPGNLQEDLAGKKVTLHLKG